MTFGGGEAAVQVLAFATRPRARCVLDGSRKCAGNVSNIYRHCMRGVCVCSRSVTTHCKEIPLFSAEKDRVGGKEDCCAHSFHWEKEKGLRFVQHFVLVPDC